MSSSNGMRVRAAFVAVISKLAGAVVSGWFCYGRAGESTYGYLDDRYGAPRHHGSLDYLSASSRTKSKRTKGGLGEG
jgi:hypothetical protein